MADKKTKRRGQESAKARAGEGADTAHTPSRNAQSGQVRIIAGIWRGSKLPVADMNGLRPTGDRARETLFNWLQPLLPGSRCLDLFAGSGALGLEAASRGAAQVVMIERDNALMRQLLQQCQRLKADESVQVFCADALAFLSASSTQAVPWNVVFVDPPWASGLQNKVLQLLQQRQHQHHLSDGARVYVEAPLDYVLEIPTGWELLREQCFGQARVVLLRVA